MATLGELQGKILRILDDIQGTAYTNELIYDAISAGYVAILPWVPKTARDDTVVVGDGSITDFAIPADLFEVQALIVQETGEVLPRAIFEPGSYHGEVIEPANDWIEFPNGYLSFSKPPKSGEVYELWYTAFWTMPDDMTEDSEVLEVPSAVITGLTYYASSYALMPSAVGSAELRQFGTRPDTGTPEHNPVRDAVTFLMSAFQREMNRIPKFHGMQT